MNPSRNLARVRFEQDSDSFDPYKLHMGFQANGELLTSSLYNLLRQNFLNLVK